MAQDWTRSEGMIIGHELDPSVVAGELKERAILAQLEWFPSTPQLLGLNVAVADDRVAIVPASSTEVVPGPTPAELADELAILFDAEVRIGNATADHLPEGDSPLGTVWPSDEEASATAEPTPTRIVEIGRTPASSVPLLAALEGVDLGDLELADDHRALLAELPAEKEGWNFGDLPLVTLSVTDGEFQVFLVTDDHLEHIVSHNWGMDAAIVPGGHDKALNLPGEVIDLVGDRLDLQAIAQAVPGADADALWASVATTGEESVWKVVRALGLPGSVAGFLLGTTDIEDVEGVTVHLARGISNAIGRSVDIMMGQPQSVVKPLWNSYESVAVERPWIIHAAVAAEAIVGVGMLVAAVRATPPRSGWMRVAGIVGGLMVVDSIAELSLAKHVSKRFARRAGEAYRPTPPRRETAGDAQASPAVVSFPVGERGRALPRLVRQGLGREILRAIREDARDTPRGQLAGLLHVVDGPHVDLEAGVAHGAHIGLGETLNARVDRRGAEGGSALTPLLGRALDEPAERNRRAGLVEGTQQVVVEGGHEEARGYLVPGERDGQGLDEAFAQADAARARLDLQVCAHLLSVREREHVRGLGNTLETVRVREPTARIQSADVREPELVVGAGPCRCAIQGVVVDDDQGAVADDVHVELEPARADLHGLGKRRDRVLGSQRGCAAVGEDAGKFRHRCS